MKGYLYIMIAMKLLAGSVLAFGQNTMINPHKFSGKSWVYTERCNPCHLDNPDREEEGGFLIAYERDSLSAADSTGLSGISKLCYACHDGTVASFNHSVDFEEAISADGMNHNHPVSIIYQSDSLSRYKLYNPETKMSGLGGTIADDMLVNGRVECTSCHDAHFSMTKTSCKSCPPGKNNEITSLWVKNSKSALCLICHDI